MNKHTVLAIDTFKKLRRAERRVDALTSELLSYVIAIPADEMDTYIEQTTEVDA